MSQTETTAAPTAEKSADFKCSCGRTFAHEISLKRHRWVTGHAEAEPEAAAPAAAAAPVETAAPSVGPALLTTATELPFTPAPLAPSAHEAYEAAMEALLAKAREQQNYERRARLQAVADLLIEFFQWMLGLAGQAAQSVLNAARGAATQSLQGAAVLGRSVLLAAGIIALLCGGLTAGRALATGSPQPAHEAPAVAERTVPAERELVGANLGGPEATVESFYSALDADDYQAAYTQLSSGWKRQLPYASFEAGYAQTSSLQCRIVDVDQLGNRSAEVEFALQTVENGRVRDYVGTYVVVETERGWQLDAGTLRAR